MNVSGNQLLIEYIRPWKLSTFAIGLGLLIAGSFYYQAPDWDIPISIIMAGLTYLTASWSVGVIRDRRWKLLPLALFYYWVSVDGAYWLYWSITKPDALIMREANFFASTCLYWLCGMIWLHSGSLREMITLRKTTAR